jgi:hypothetical protein
VCTQSNVADFDRQTLNMYKYLHPRSDLHRLYLPLEKDSPGLKEAKSVIPKKNKSLSLPLSFLEKRIPMEKKDSHPTLLKAVWL